MQVMRGVIEEKTNRIIEVIISSVKPFQLMMGKILGVGLVGLTQFTLWITLTFVLTTVSSSMLPSQQIAKAAQEQMSEMPQKDKDKIAKKMEQTPSDAGKVMAFIQKVPKTSIFRSLLAAFCSISYLAICFMPRFMEQSARRLITKPIPNNLCSRLCCRYWLAT